MSKLIKRTKEQREADMNTLSRLYVKGISQMEIARQLGISQGQVSNDLKRLLKHWEDTRLDEIDRYKHEQLLRINMIEEEMWTAWEKSKTKGKRTVAMSKSGDVADAVDSVTGRKVKVDAEKYWRAGTTEEEPVAGDMQYMNGIMWCQQERAKIVGLYAPKKVAATDPTGNFEAVGSAKEELMGMLSGIVKRMKPETPEEQNYVEGVLVNQLEADNTKEVSGDNLSELAQRLNRERLSRIPDLSEPMQFDETGAILTKATDVEGVEGVEDDKNFLANLRQKIGE